MHQWHHRLAAVLTLLPGSIAAAEIAFAPSSEFAAGPTPIGMVTGDVNGDGHCDLIASNRESNTITVLFNDGAGTLEVAFITPVGSEPRTPALSDIDHDGDLDLVVPHFGDGADSIGVLFNDGAGQFGQRVDHAVGAKPRTASSADLDGDGHPDLAVANYGSNSLSVLIGDGAGGFAAAVSYPTGTIPNSVSIADLDGDGDLDLAASHRGSHDVWVLLNEGAGTFAPGTSYAVGYVPKDESLADLDGDGDIDIVSANGWSNSVSVLVNDGSGTFTAGPELGGALHTHAVTTADFDGDGLVDIASISDSSARVYRNLGFATFQYPPLTRSLGFGAIFVVQDDFSGDDRPDLVVSNLLSAQVHVLLNESLLPACVTDAADCNGNGLLDGCEIADGWSNDCDGDGVPDDCQVTADPQLDANGDGLLDTCEREGDVNADGWVNIDDLTYIFSTWGPCPEGPSNPCPGNTNGDDRVDIDDVIVVIVNFD